MLRDREGTMSALLGILAEAGKPVGTRAAVAELQQNYDTRLSESTMARLFHEMDSRGWTTAVATKGRVLTQEGRLRHEQVVIATRTSDSLTSAISVKTVSDMLELMNARLAVESAIAADAANRSTKEDVAELRRLAKVQADQLAVEPVNGGAGLLFHRKVAEISANPMLKVFAGILLAPQLDSVEEAMDIILGERNRELSVVDHHQAIVEAIEASDPEAAEQATRRHFSEMIAEAEQYLVGRNAEVFERLLQFVGSRSDAASAHE